jgi:hypothetical protein
MINLARFSRRNVGCYWTCSGSRPSRSKAFYWIGRADRILVEYGLQGDLFMALAADQHCDEGFAVVFRAQMDLGREPDLRAPRRLAPIPMAPPEYRRAGESRQRFADTP